MMTTRLTPRTLFFYPFLATKFFAKPRTAANATAPGTATVRRDGDQKARQTKHGTRTADQNTDRQNRPPTTRHGHRQANAAQTTSEGSRQEHATTAPQTNQPTDDDDATKPKQHGTATGNGQQRHETETTTTATAPSQKTKEHEGQQPTQQTPPDRQENTTAHNGNDRHGQLVRPRGCRKRNAP